MRDDAIGFFWQDYPREKGTRSAPVRPMPPIPDTGWTAPQQFPNLRAARVLAIDTETYDPELKEHGPGWARKRGHIVGVSIAADDDGRWYFPVRHTIEPEHNLAPESVFAWLRDALADPRQPKLGANLPYDIGWLLEEGVEVRGPLMDVLSAEALLLERGEINLDFLGKKYCGVGKEDDQLYRWLADFYGGKANGDQRKNIWRAPPRLVGPYAEQDAVLPIQIARAQYPELRAQGLLDVLEMENGLIPLIVAMRRAGVQVDIDKAEQVRERLLREQQEAQAKLDTLAGQHVEVNAASSIARAFDSVGIAYPRTEPTERAPEGNPSFTGAWLEGCPHEMGRLIREVRKLDKLRGTFVESYVLNNHANERIHGQFHLLRGDSNGTRSGRFSSSTPNLQNLPSRDSELAPLVRGIFIPDVGHVAWRCYDYSQIEYRFLLHFAVGDGAEEARRSYFEDADMDYHGFVIDQVRAITNYELDRKPAKNLNFGLIYGMGKPKLTRMLGLSKAQANALFDAYHTSLPYVRATMDATAKEAAATGVITTVLGRRSRFDLFTEKGARGKVVPLPLPAALRRYGSVERAFTHKALNRRLQGSAADLMKYTMWRCWEDGVFAETGVPRLTVHDELDFSDPGGKDAAFAYMQRVMETALPLRVPVRCKAERGPDWGHLATL